MSGRRRTVDRRAGPRFEVVGDLAGTLELTRPLPLVDVSTGGALIESDQCWDIGSKHSVVIANGVAVGHAEISVRHVRPGAGAVRFLVGVEFVSLSPALLEQIVRWLNAEGGAPAGGGSAK